MKDTVIFRMKKRRIGEKPPDLVAYLFGPMENRKDHGAKLRRLIYEKSRRIQTKVKITFLDPVALEYLKTRETAVRTKRSVIDAICIGNIEAVQSRMWPIKTVDLEIVKYMAELDGKEGRPRGILIGCFPRSPEIEKVEEIVDSFIDKYEGILLDQWTTKHPFQEDGGDGEEENISQEEEVTFISFLRENLGEVLKEYLFRKLGEFLTTGGSSLEIGKGWELLVPIFLVSDNDLVTEDLRVSREEFMTRLSSKWILSDVLDVGEIFMVVDELFEFLAKNLKDIKNGEYTSAKLKVIKEWKRKVEERKLVINI
ncbi:MAG: hypothetical protein Q8R29_02760 [bacterium]|nr:hypothetical protein [bacterium]